MTDDLRFYKSERKNKKYAVVVNDKVIHFGDTRYQQYQDKTPLKLYSYLNHYDEKRRLNRNVMKKQDLKNILHRGFRIIIYGRK